MFSLNEDSLRNRANSNDCDVGMQSQAPVPTDHGAHPTPPTSRKPRVALACKRCKRRKQRCDGSQPACRSCSKGGFVCEYEKALRPQYPGGKSLYITCLEERIAFLESQLPDFAEDHFEVSRDPNAADVVHETNSREACSSLRNPHDGQNLRTSVGPDESANRSDSSLVDGVAYLSLYASGATDAAPEPHFLGPSSGATIARFIQSSIFHDSNRKLPDKPPSFGVDYEQSIPESPDPPDNIGSTIDFPEIQISRMLFDTFFDRVHTRWPLLNRGAYEKLFDRQYIPGALSLVQTSIFHLIYAITAHFLLLTRKPCGIEADVHLAAAVQRMDHILEQHSMATVQFLLLLGVHGQRSPFGAGAWTQVRYAMSICIEMGLHRRRHQGKVIGNGQDAELKSRAFWCCYSLDRSTSKVLGRPFAIEERDINAELPSASIEFWTLTHSGPRHDATSSSTNIAPFIHIVKLDRIQSRIYKTVSRIDQDVFAKTEHIRSKVDRKTTSLKSELDDWLTSCPHTPKEPNKTAWMYDPENAYLDARDFYNVQYHKAVLFLYTNFLPTLSPEDHRFVTCVQAAAAVCTAYKRLNQTRTLTYTMISLHSCNMARLTLVYCLWRGRSLFSYEAFEATRACSQSLTIFGEKWAGAVKYRDIFDALSGSLFKTIMNSQASALQLDLQTPPLPLVPETSRSMQEHSSTPRRQFRRQSQTEARSVHSVTGLTHMLSDAVKDAFMEVDEEAPGGWQAWRMWTEMTGDLPVQSAQSRWNEPDEQEPMADAASDTRWHALGGIASNGPNPTQALFNGPANFANSWEDNITR